MLKIQPTNEEMLVEKFSEWHWNNARVDRMAMVKVCRYYTFEFEFKNRAKLPKWKGNLIRGSIGYHLRMLSCQKSKDCNKCEQLFDCPFGYIFKAKSKGLILKKIEGFTKPYVVKPPLEEKETYEARDTFSFSLVIFGDAVKFEEKIIEAVLSLSKAGLGVKRFRSPLKLKRVVVENPFTEKSKVLFDGSFHDSNVFVRDSHLKIDVGDTFVVSFLTPFRLVRNRLLIEPTFKDLTAFLLRRYSAIRYQYLGSDLDMDVYKVLERSEKVDTVFTNLKRRSFTYKNEEKEFLYGEIAFKGKLNSKLRKLLAFGTLAHVGKLATFGFGWFKVV